METKGKFIVLYGINNLGKTTQAKILVEKLNKQNIKTEYIKYAIYDLTPSGVLLNDYLRKGNLYKLTPREAQIIQVLNRTQYETTIKEKLSKGITIIAEDYTGTGLAWGMGANVDEKFLKYVNSHLLKEDLAILMDGTRFSESIETNHEHETNNGLTNKVRLMHLKLAEEYSWPIVNANDNVETVHKHIWKQVKYLMRNDNEDLNELIEKSYPQQNLEEIDIQYINKTSENENPRSLFENKSQNNIIKNLELKVNKTTSDTKLPTRAHDTDAGLDLYANDNYTLFENDIIPIDTGIRMAIPNGHAGLIWDKSGLANQGLKTMGGVIDSGYRGEIKVVVTNLSGDIIHIKKGQKIAQILIQKIEAPALRKVDALDDSEREDRGFGSSGIF